MSLLRSLPSAGGWVVAVVVTSGVAIVIGTSGDGPSPKPSAQARLVAPVSEGSVAKERRVRDGAAARALRRTSRSRYADLGARRAAALVRKTFPEQMRAPVFNAHRLGAGKRIVAQLAPGKALVEDKNGHQELLVSTAALQAQNEQGKLAAVDLSLERTLAGIAPVNSSAPIVIDPSSPAKVKFTGLGMAMQVAGTQDSAGGPKAAARSVSAELSDDRAFFANVLTDTDAGVLPLPNGSEVFLIARSDQAPERFGLALDLPAGATLRRAVSATPVPEGVPLSIEVVKDSKPLAYISSPVAHDADGLGVAASMSIDGENIVLDVPHRSLDVRYPLSIDPEVITAVAWTDHASHFAGWTSTKSHANWFAAIDNCAVYCGLYQGIPQYTTVPANSNAYFSFQAPAKTALTEAQLGGLASVPYVISNVPFTRAYQGILKDSTWEPGRFRNQDSLQPDTGYAASVPTGNAFWGHTNQFNVTPTATGGTLARDDNKAIMAMSAIYTVPATVTHGATTMAWARFLIADKHKPQWHPNTTAPIDTGWTDDNNETHSRSFRATDEGLGVYRLTLTGASIQPFPTAQGTLSGDTITARCTGTPPQPVCPADWPSSPIDYKLNEGVNTLTAQATDLVGNTVGPARTWTEKIDRGAPTVDLPTVPEADPLEPGDQIPNEEPSGVYVAVNEPTYSLSVDASDTRSGVASIALAAPNGTIVDQHSPSCSPECPNTIATELTGVTASLNELDEYTVSVTDRAGHTVTHSVVLIADRTPPPAPTALALADFEPILGPATIEWSVEADPDIAGDDVPGSGTFDFEYRYKRLLGDFTAWIRTASDAFTMPGVLAEPVTVEVRQLDAAGNRGPAASADLLLVPPPPPAPPPTPSGGTNVLDVLHHLVLEDDTGGEQTVPFPGTPVILVGPAGTQYPAETDDDGTATFTNIPDGSFEVLIGDAPEGPAHTEQVTLTGGETRLLSATTRQRAGTKELAWCAYHSVTLCSNFFGDAKKAARYARRLFNRNPPGNDVYDNTRANAFKHAYWVALMVNTTDDHGEADNSDALAFASLHEDISNPTWKERRSIAMDKHNNRMAYTLANERAAQHNETYFCNVLRHRIKQSRQVSFRPNEHDTFKYPVSTNYLVFRWKYPDGKANNQPAVRLKPKSDFQSGEPCNS